MREETRERVLAAAARVFAQRGFDATSLEAIADEAGFSRGAVYYNFADKEGLFLERAAHLDAALRKASPERRITGRRSEEAEVERAPLRVAGHRVERMLGGNLRLSTRRVSDRTRPVADTLGMTPEQLAVVIDALGVGLWAQHMLHGSRTVPPDLYSKALALVVDGIAARTTVPGGTT